MYTKAFSSFVMLCAVITPNVDKAPKKVEPKKPVQKVEKLKIPVPFRPRVFVEPEKVRVPKGCPFPTVRDCIIFECPNCGLRMFTHVLYPHLPYCPKETCDCVMHEVIDEVKK